jgi:hypothetical protein
MVVVAAALFAGDVTALFTNVGTYIATESAIAS